MVLACLLLFDAFRRVIKTKISNSAVSVQAVFFLSVSFLALGISTFNLILADQEVWLVYASLVSFTVSYGILAFILFRMGVQAFQTYTDDNSDFPINATE